MVVICFHFSNFEPLETALWWWAYAYRQLWFAFILVTLSHWKQQLKELYGRLRVVICFHFSNFEPLETASPQWRIHGCSLWFAFILVTLSHWKQRSKYGWSIEAVVICFHFSNFEPLETASWSFTWYLERLWFAFILVTLSHWKQHQQEN